jgi:hypothetical protein
VPLFGPRRTLKPAVILFFSSHTRNVLVPQRLIRAGADPSLGAKGLPPASLARYCVILCMLACAFVFAGAHVCFI